MICKINDIAMYRAGRRCFLPTGMVPILECTKVKPYCRASEENKYIDFMATFNESVVRLTQISEQKIGG